MEIKLILDLNTKRFQIKSTDFADTWGMFYFDECEITDNLIKLYYKVNATTRLFIGAFAREGVEVINKEETE